MPENRVSRDATVPMSDGAYQVVRSDGYCILEAVDIRRAVNTINLFQHNMTAVVLRDKMIVFDNRWVEERFGWVEERLEQDYTDGQFVALAQQVLDA